MTHSPPSHCSTCGAAIEDGTGRYITPGGIYCSTCGPPFPLGDGVKVTITILDPEHRLDQYTNKNRR